MKKKSLKFIDNKIEEKYEKMALEKMHPFAISGWVIIAFMTVVFSFLDKIVFVENTTLVFSMRIILFACSITLILLLIFKPYKLLMKLNSSLFIIILGTFSIFISTLCGEKTFPFYSMSLVFAFSGLFTSAGYGFKNILTSIIILTILFELIIGYTKPVSMEVFLISSVFIWSFAFVFSFMAYLLEITLRKSFAVSEKLLYSLDNVKQLSEILPICSHCKNIRDDSGYWKQVEDYFQSHTETVFTHSLCPNCVDKLYPDLGINEDGYSVDE